MDSSEGSVGIKVLDVKAKDREAELDLAIAKWAAKDSRIGSSACLIVGDLLSEFREVFQEPWKLPPDRPETMEINLVDHYKLPPVRGVGKLSESELELLKAKLIELLDKGFIRPSTSRFSAGILFVKKADGSMRLCIDYRALNDITHKNLCPIPNVTEMRGLLKDAKYFSTVDMKEGYTAIRMKEEDIHKTAFRCRYGHFEYTVIPFGLTNAPAVFCGMINRVLSPYLDWFLIAYLDDIVTYSRTKEEHYEHLRMLFEVLQRNQLHLKLSKCDFLADEVSFCGHTISRSGLKVSPSKVVAMQQRPVIQTPRDIQSWLGSCVWFADFIPDYANITACLTELLKKDTKWKWGEEQEEAVSILIFLITTAPVLRYFDHTRETVVYTDASKWAVGGWLGQKYDDGVHPVIFWSRKLKQAERNYPTHDKELLALVKFCSKHAYLLRGVQFTANTDHKALVYLQTQEHLNERQTRWVMLLQEFKFTLQYWPGSQNNVADFLSRNALVAPLCDNCQTPLKIFAARTTQSFYTRIRAALEDDTLAKKIRGWISNKKLLSGSDLLESANYTLENDLIFYAATRLYVPDSNNLRVELLSRYHDHPCEGHQGVRRSLEKLQKRYFWPGIQADVSKYVRSCDTCQRFRDSTKSRSGYLHPLPVPADRFTEIAMDFMSLPISLSGYDCALVVVDRLTKLVRLIPCLSTITAEGCAEILYKQWFCTGKGFPSHIVSDRDPLFASSVWAEFCRLAGISVDMATARHQQTDGQAENCVKISKRILRKYVSFNQDDWDQQLPMVEYAMNSAVSRSTGFTPFFLAYGYEPRDTGADYVFKTSASDLVRTHLKRTCDGLGTQYSRHRSRNRCFTTGNAFNPTPSSQETRSCCPQRESSGPPTLNGPPGCERRG
jgi:hypothetical protein